MGIYSQWFVYRIWIYNNAKFHFKLLNFTNSLQKINVEFKYGSFTKILDSFEFDLIAGENTLDIPLITMQSNALKYITEICFVIRPEYILEDEGMFNISDVTII